MNILKIIIVIILIIILSLLLIKLFTNKTSKSYGSDFKLSDDICEEYEDRIEDTPFPTINKSSYASLFYINPTQNYNLPYSVSEFKLIQKVYGDKHIEFISYICEYINNMQFIINDNDNSDSKTTYVSQDEKNIIVGDVHGSILQLFMPLKEAGIITRIEFNTSNKEFRISISSDENIRNAKQVIYCGDFVGRAKHPLTVEMLLAFIDIYNKVNLIIPDKIVWVFGNHDIGFIRKFILDLPAATNVYHSEYDEIMYSYKLPELKNKLFDLACNNKYPCIYYLDVSDTENKINKNLMVSHTIIPILEHENKISDIKWFGLNILYYLFNNIEFENVINENKDITLYKKINDKIDFTDSINDFYDENKPSKQFITELIKQREREEMIIKQKQREKEEMIIKQKQKEEQPKPVEIVVEKKEEQPKPVRRGLRRSKFVEEVPTTQNTDDEKKEEQPKPVEIVVEKKEVPTTENTDDEKKEEESKPVRRGLSRSKFTQGIFQQRELVDLVLEKCKQFRNINNIYKNKIMDIENKKYDIVFNNLSISEKISFINKLAKYYVIFNPLPCYSDIEFELYWSRFNDDGFKQNEIFTHNNTLYFIGHTPNLAISKLLDDLKHINNQNKINISSTEIKNKIHLNYITKLKNDNNINKDSKIIEYNNKIISYNENVAKIIEIINDKYKNENELNIKIGMQEPGLPYYLIDFYNTSALSTDKHIDRMTMKETKNMFEYLKYDVDKMKLLKSIELGFNMGLYVKVNSAGKVKLSKLYLL